MTMRVTHRVFWLACLLAVLPQLAWAHAKMVRSDPAARATLQRAPAVIQLWFNERVEPAYSSVELRDAQDKVVSTQKASVSPADPKLLTLPVPPLGDGEYTVVFRVLSVDGHVVKSRYRFTLRAPAQ